MTHGYFDSIHVPLHLSPSAYQPQPSSKATTGTGKGKEVATAPPPDQYDVVASWTRQDLIDMQHKVKLASMLGYSTLLLTLSIPPTFDPSNLVFPTPLFPDLDPRTATPGTPGLVMQLWRINVQGYTDEAVKGAGGKGWYGFANSTAALYPPQTTLLSVTPTSLTSFSHVALSLSPPSAFSPTLIILDPSLSPRLPFPLKRGLISSLSRAGVRFELILRGVTRQDEPGEQPGEAGKRRRNWIAGAREVVRATEGKGVVISSGAHKAGEMRGSEDLINLCSLIGLPPAAAKDTLTVNPQRAVLRGLSLRQTYRGVLSNPTLTLSSDSPLPQPSTSTSTSTSTPQPVIAGKKRPADASPSGEGEGGTQGGPSRPASSTASSHSGQVGDGAGGGGKKKKRKQIKKEMEEAAAKAGGSSGAGGV